MYTQRREPFRWSLLALVPTLLLTTSARGQQPQAPGAPTGSVLVRTGDPAPATARFGTAYDSVAAAPDGLAFIDRNRTALFLKGPAEVRTIAFSGEEVAGGARLAALSRVSAGADGTLAFLADLADSRQGIYRIGPDRASPEEVVVTGSTLDLGDGEVTVAMLYEPVVDGDGGVVAGVQFFEGTSAVVRYGRASAPEIVLKSGDPIGAEVFLTLLAGPAVNASGRIAVSTGLESGATAVLVLSPGEAPAVAFFLAAPLTPQSPFVAYAPPAVGDGGQVAFFFVNAGQLRLRQFENGFGFNVAGPGTPAPGGGTFTELTDVRPGLDALGRVFFGAQRSNGRRGFYLAGTSITRLAETGMAAGDAGVLDRIEVRQPLAAAALDAAGTLHFGAEGTSASGLLRASAQGIGIEVRSGDPIDGARFASFIEARVPFMGGGPALAPGGLMIFDARLTGGSRGLFARDRDGGIVAVAMDGDDAPGGGRFDGERFAYHSINASGTFAFLGSVLGGPSPATYSLFYGGLHGEPLRKVIDTQPTIAAGGSAGDRVEAAPTRINASGRVAVTVKQADGTSVLWGYDGATLSRIAGPGDPAPAGVFTSAFTGSLFTGLPIAPALGDDGIVLFGAQTAGGDSALFKARVAAGPGEVPERVLGLGDEVEGGRLSPFELQAIDRESSGRVVLQSIYSEEFDFADFLRDLGPAERIASRFDPILDIGFVLLVSPQLVFTGDGGLAYGVSLFDGSEAVLLRPPGEGVDPVVVAMSDQASPDGGVYVGFQPGRRSPARLATDGRGSLVLAAATTAGPEAIIQFGSPNESPLADAGPDQTVECARPSGADVVLDGRASSDPEGTALRYIWSGPFGQVEGAQPAVVLPLGASTVTLVVDDGEAVSEPDAVRIVVRDTQPPRIATIAASGILWPPDGRMVDVSFSVAASDVCDPAPAVALLEVASSEPTGGRAGAQVAGATLGIDDRQVALRADRSGNGPGRTYLVTYGALDRAGNLATAGATVFVPHDRGR